MSSFRSIKRELVAAPQSSNRLVQVLGGGAVLALLYVGGDTLIPFTLAIVLVPVLLEHDVLRSLCTRLLGATEAPLATAAKNDAGGKPSRFFLLRLAIHRLVGVMILAGLTALGLAHAALLLEDGPVVSLPPRFCRRAHCNTCRRELQGSAFLQWLLLNGARAGSGICPSDTRGCPGPRHRRCSGIKFA
jgi:hypothetical protein